MLWTRSWNKTSVTDMIHLRLIYPSGVKVRNSQVVSVEQKVQEVPSVPFQSNKSPIIDDVFHDGIFTITCQFINAAIAQSCPTSLYLSRLNRVSKEEIWYGVYLTSINVIYFKLRANKPAWIVLPTGSPQAFVACYQYEQLSREWWPLWRLYVQTADGILETTLQRPLLHVIMDSFWCAVVLVV